MSVRSKKNGFPVTVRTHGATAPFQLFLALGAISALTGCAKPLNKAEPQSDGTCDYVDSVGTAEIVAVPAGIPGNSYRWITLHWTPDGGTTERDTRATSMSGDCVVAEHVISGAKLRATLGTLTRGFCAPYRFDFFELSDPGCRSQ